MNTIILINSLEEHTYFLLCAVRGEQYEGFVMPLAKINLWVGGACSLHRGVVKKQGAQIDLALVSVESSCQDSAILVPGTCLFLCSSVADLTSCLVQSLHHLLLTTALSLKADCSLALLNPSLRNPSEGLSCLPLKGALFTPNGQVLIYMFPNLFSMNIGFPKTLKSLSSLNNSVVLTTG